MGKSRENLIPFVPFNPPLEVFIIIYKEVMINMDSDEKVVDYQALGEKIQERRRQMGLTQSTAAEKLDLSVSFYSRVERGEKVASLETIIKIANHFGFSLDFLFQDSLQNGVSEALQVELSQIFTDKTPNQAQKLTKWLRMLSENIEMLD
jgi:transcriptional regulator with XRE-family HTH domain